MKITEKYPWVKKHPVLTGCCVFAVIVLSICYIPALFMWRYTNGALGDAFGFWNSIFSGAALIGIVYSIFHQRKELKLQHEELEKTSAALKGQLDQQRKDNFEATFFRTFSILQEISGQVRLPQLLRIGPYREHRGFDAFEYALETIDAVLPVQKNEDMAILHIQKHSPLREYGDLPSNKEFFEILYKTFSSGFGQYYCLLYNLLKMINKADFLEDRQFYVNLIRATLAKSHLVLIALNCASQKGSLKFQPLLVQWSVLKHLPEKYVHNFGLKQVYPKGIYAIGRWEPEED